MEKKILVVDDEKMIRDMLHNAFDRHGYHVRSAENAERAMAILKEESIMIMLLDLDLPGMGGIEFCKKIRRENHLGFIFAITGVVDIYSLIGCRSVGFDDFFTKPFSLDLMVTVVEQAFEKLRRWKVEEYNLF